MRSVNQRKKTTLYISLNARLLGLSKFGLQLVDSVFIQGNVVGFGRRRRPCCVTVAWPSGRLSLGMDRKGNVVSDNGPDFGSELFRRRSKAVQSSVKESVCWPMP